jgi:hypothetical protein
MELTKGGKRPGFRHDRDSIDDKYHLTLKPGQPLKVSHSFGLAYRSAEGPHSLTAGHRYAFEVRQGEEVNWWREGTREEVLAPPGQSAMSEASGESIVLDTAGPVEFTVLPPKT